MARASAIDLRLTELYRLYADGRVGRRGFIRGAAAAIAAGVSIPSWMLGSPAHAAAQAAGAGSSGARAARSRRVELLLGRRRTRRIWRAAPCVNGKQMYVEILRFPRKVKHPYPIVLVHGGGGQGTRLDGHARRPPRLVHHSPARKATRSTSSIVPATAARRFIPTSTAPSRRRTSRSNRSPAGSRRPMRRRPANDALAPSCTTSGRAPARSARPSWTSWSRRKAGPTSPVPACRVRHEVWRTARRGMLLDKIGPAIIMTHSAGGPFGWLVAEVRPKLVKGIVVIEGGGRSRLAAPTRGACPRFPSRTIRR